MAIRHLSNLPSLAVLAFLVAGCTAAPPTEPSAPGADPETVQVMADAEAQGGPAEGVAPAPTSPEEKPETAVEPRSVRVYASQGLFVGTDPAHPLADGPLVEAIVSREDMFVAPPGTLGLEVSFGFRIGAWSGGFDIVHESGLVVYHMESLVAASDGGGCVAGHCTPVYVGKDSWAADTAPPGNYTLLYHFVGAVYGAITVDAIVEDCGSRPCRS